MILILVVCDIMLNAIRFLVHDTRTIVMSSLEDVLTEWHDNHAFRQEFKKNPEQALANAGLTLSPSDLLKIQGMLKNKDDDTSTGGSSDELDKRINK